MRFSKLTVDLQEQIAIGAYNVATPSAEQRAYLDSLKAVQLWEIVLPRLRPHAMHYAHESIFAKEPRIELANALACLLTDRQYVVIDQNPLYHGRLSIEFPRPGKVKCTAYDDYLDITDDYGVWCSLLPFSADTYRGELIFGVNRRKDFIRTFRFVRSPSDPIWQTVEDTFYEAYGV